MQIQEYKALFPEYEDKSLEWFAQKTWKKHYSDMPWRVFQVKSGLLPVKELQAIDETQYALKETVKGMSKVFGEGLIGAVETGASVAGMGLEFVASAIPGMAGIVEGLRTGNPEAATAVIQKIQTEMHPYLVYEPVTESGKQGVATIRRGFELLGELGQWITRETGLTRHPVLSTTLESLVELLPVIVAPMFFKKRGMRPVNPEDILRLEQEIKKVSEQMEYPRTRISEVLSELRQKPQAEPLPKEKLSEEGISGAIKKNMVELRRIAETELKPPPSVEFNNNLLKHTEDLGFTDGELGAILVSPEAIRNAFKGALKHWDVEGPFKSMGKPETGFHLKNFYSEWERWTEKASRSAGFEYIWEKPFRKGKKPAIPELTKEQRADAVLMLEKPREFVAGTEFEKIYDAWHNYRKEVLGEMKKLKILKKGWPHSMIDSIIAENEVFAKQMEKLKGKTSGSYGKKLELKEKIAQNEEIIARLQDKEFVHIPLKYWFEDRAMGDPSFAAKTLRYLARKKRKTISIQDFLDDGILKLEDLDILDVFKSYGRRAGKDIALGKIVNAAIKDGLLTKIPKEGYIELPTYRFPILKGYYADPVMADFFHNFLNTVGRQSTLRNFFAITKMWQFIQPAYLGMIDAVQYGMASLLDPKAAVKLPKYIAEAVHDVFRKTPEYWEAQEHGIRSKPYNNPLRNWEEMMDSLKGENRTLWKMMQRNFGPQALKTIYNLSWDLAWNLFDPLIRQISYRYFLDKGFPPRDAAQISARFCADYASFPWETRGWLNIPFFTPTYKLAMAKLYGEMFKSVGGAIKGQKFSAETINAMKIKGSRVMAKGLINTTAMLLAVHWYWTRFQGFKTDQFGRRYFKRVKTPNPETGIEEDKELVVAWSAPINMWFKYYFRGKQALEPGEDTALKQFILMNKWELHPTWRIGLEVAENTNENGEPIVEYNDPWDIKMLKRSYYVTTRLLRFTGLLDRAQKDARAQAALAKEIGKLQQLSWYPFAFAYLRDPESRRVMWRIQDLNKQLKRQLVRKGAIPKDNLKEHQKQIKFLIDKMESEFHDREPVYEPVPEEPDKEAAMMGIP